MKKIYMTSLLALASLRAADLPGNVAADHPGVTLRIVNDASVRTGDLDLAQKGVGRILCDAGVRLTWRSCDLDDPDGHSPDPSKAGRGQVELQVRFTAWRPQRASHKDTADRTAVSIFPGLGHFFWGPPPLISIGELSFSSGELT